MPHRTLDDKREQMINFLLENIVAKNVRRHGSDITFTDGRNRDYSISALSRQADFPFDFEEDPRIFDNDRKRLDTICEEIASVIQEKNDEGLIPGFVLLQADTDYSQLIEERTEFLVNHGHFLKQELPSHARPHTRWDIRTLDSFELALLQFYRHTEESLGKRSVKKIGVYNPRRVYHPELVYFNTKRGTIEAVWFADTSDPLKFKLDNCPVCKNPNEERYTHESCREEPAYTKYVMRRNEARYTNRIMVSRTRRSKDSRAGTQAEIGVRFKPTTIDNTKLDVPEGLYIAVVR